MEGLREFLERIRQAQLVPGNFRALLHILIGRKIVAADGTLVSAGVTWRDLSDLFRQIRWDKELVRELGLHPDDLPPRDRQRYWYSAIAAAHVSSIQARDQADAMVPKLRSLGYVVGPAPGA